jgi:hypothetical protein
MPRGWSSANKTAVAAAVIRPVNMVKLEFVSGTIYYTDADRDIVFGGDTYLGTGVLAGFSSVEEGVELQTYTITLSLSGVPSSVISLALNEDFQNRNCTMYTGFLGEGDTIDTVSDWDTIADFDSAGGKDYYLIADPIEIFKGRINQMNIESGATSTVSLTVESRLVDWERPRVRRYNNADQQIEYSSDKGFEFVPQMVDKEIVWGRA